MTHINEFTPIIREPTTEHAQNTLDSVIPGEVNDLIPGIFERLDNHEATEDVAIDTLPSIFDIVETTVLRDGVDIIFNNGIVDRIAFMITNALNDIIVRSAEYLGIGI